MRGKGGLEERTEQTFAELGKKRCGRKGKSFLFTQARKLEKKTRRGGVKSKEGAEGGTWSG